ncbi:MAG: class I SAM-dependent DNA methyltransferase, partial [Prevotella sp.]|nr:class I SAM-dependent DNA methyltransferase [Prevotella sp.]
MKNEKQIATSAAEFAERWKGRGYERGESQPFWIDLLSNVFGIETPSDGFIVFEDHQMVDASNFIDGRIPSTRVLIEQKSLGKDLRAPIKQSDGSLLNPFQQARRYVVSLPVSEHPRWIVTCNFSEFLVYDMEQPNGEPERILLEDLGKEYYRLMFLVDAKNEHLSKEMQVSMQAGEIVGKIYEALLKQYDDNSPEALRWLNILCVRIVFCLYAEDAGVFTHDQFHDFLVSYEAKDLRRALRDLFEVLNTPTDKRSKYLQEELKAFPYTNGGLFEEDIEIPQFTEELKQTLLQNASLDFDWSEISPTIFGAVFESTLNPETRRSGGMHYTSIENIHKVIDPLFLNDLRHELDEILEEKVERQRQKKLDAYQNRLASLTFLDPACGSGNFLTETYLSLRRLENEVIRERHHGQAFIGFEEVNPIKVSIQQFYGIEINDFAVTVATTALWISEAQMLRETEKIIRRDIDFLPLKSYINIREGNALRMDWDVMEIPDNVPTIYAKNAYVIFEDEPMMVSEHLVELEEVNLIASHRNRIPKLPKRYRVRYDYIIGNPPFVGQAMRTKEQTDDLKVVFAPSKDYGKLDYVAGWFKKAAELIKGTNAEAAFVSSNSICQGESVNLFWQKLLGDNLFINFAHNTFKWKSEAKSTAGVSCVIVGFSYKERKDKLLFNGEKYEIVEHINGYLKAAPDVYIKNRSKSINEGLAKVVQGSPPADDGRLLFSKAEREELVKRYPELDEVLLPFVGSREFINDTDYTRYCLWLVGKRPADYAH